MDLPPLTPEEIPSFQGAKNARVIIIALFSLTVYEWMITFDDEVDLSHQLLAIL
ncbi:hypothetical protein B0H17DRAFT_1214136 [Mycena rosella]|uniref:Uncharacterized protein n=1 Tax=Mycena rosella TaxID=1033263 RepID=A0AAD7CNP0_MYCRO|nr:hypothetical protein B0H17DRAFT_1214136 [Mycena rosella]